VLVSPWQTGGQRTNEKVSSTRFEFRSKGSTPKERERDPTHDSKVSLSERGVASNPSGPGSREHDLRESVESDDSSVYITGDERFDAGVTVESFDCRYPKTKKKKWISREEDSRGKEGREKVELIENGSRRTHQLPRCRPPEDRKREEEEHKRRVRLFERRDRRCTPGTLKEEKEKEMRGVSSNSAGRVRAEIETHEARSRGRPPC